MFPEEAVPPFNFTFSSFRTAQIAYTRDSEASNAIVLTIWKVPNETINQFRMCEGFLIIDSTLETIEETLSVREIVQGNEQVLACEEYLLQFEVVPGPLP